MTIPDMRKNWGSPNSIFQKLISWGRQRQFLLTFVSPRGSLHKTIACSKKTVPRIFFKKPPEPSWYISLGNEKEKKGVTVLVSALRTKLSSTVIDTVSKCPNEGEHKQYGSVQDRCIQWIHGAVGWTLSFGPARSRFASGPAGFTSSDVITGSSYLRQDPLTLS